MVDQTHTVTQTTVHVSACSASSKLYIKTRISFGEYHRNDRYHNVLYSHNFTKTYSVSKLGQQLNDCCCMLNLTFNSYENWPHYESIFLSFCGIKSCTKIFPIPWVAWEIQSFTHNLRIWQPWKWNPNEIAIDPALLYTPYI